MARAALDWSIDVLAEKTDVSSRTIKRIEAQVGIPVATEANLRLIRETLPAAGIEFMGRRATVQACDCGKFDQS